MPPSKKEVDKIISWQKNPFAYIEDVWGLVPQKIKAGYDLSTCDLETAKVDWFMPFEVGKNITWQQAVFIEAVRRAVNNKASRKIAVRSGHGIGKSATLSMLIYWFLTCHLNAQVGCTAPTSYQMHDVLWKEAAAWREKMKGEFGSKFEWQGDYIRFIESPNTWFARARTARKEQPEALAGLHADDVMLLVDEGSGVPDECYNAAKSSLTNANILFIVISNPLRLTGYFHDIFDKDLGFQLLGFNSEDSPIVSKRFIDDLIAEHGKDSDEYRTRVLGLFPRADMVDSKGYVPLLMEGDIRQISDTKFVGTVKMAVDPAGEGVNETIWVVRDKFKAKIVLKEAVSTESSIVQKTLSLMELYKIEDFNVWVDNFGVGANVAQGMALAGKRINAVNVGDRPLYEDDKERFINMRAVIYWRLKEWLRQGGELMQDERWKQLLNIRYKPDLTGHLKIMGKDDMRREGIQSPDAADALSMTFWETDMPDEYKVAVEHEQQDNFDPHDPF